MDIVGKHKAQLVHLYQEHTSSQVLVLLTMIIKSML